MATRVDVKVSFEDFHVTQYMDMFDLRDLKYYDLKFPGDVVLSIVRFIIVESTY